MNNFYIITSRYVALASIGLLNQASEHSVRFEAKTMSEAKLVGGDMAEKMYPEHMYWKIISEAEKMRIDGQPQLPIGQQEHVYWEITHLGGTHRRREDV